MHYLKMSPMKPDTLPGCMAEFFSLRFFLAVDPGKRPVLDSGAPKDYITTNAT
jgi:hypothetical protein